MRKERHWSLIFDVWLEGLECDRCSLCVWGLTGSLETFVDTAWSGELCLFQLLAFSLGKTSLSVFSQARDLFPVSLVDSNIDTHVLPLKMHCGINSILVGMQI